MDRKKSFLVYLEWDAAFNSLSDAQVGQIIKAALAFHNGEEAKCADQIADFYFRFTLVPMFERNIRRYEEVCEKRKAAIKARWERADTNHTNEYKCIHENTNEYKTIQMGTDKDKDKDVSKETINKRESIKEKNEFSLSRTRTAHADCDEGLKEWFEKGNAPYIFKNFEHLVTSDELAKLKEKYSGNLISETILAIENRGDLRKKYKNLYRTLINWLKKGEKNG